MNSDGDGGLVGGVGWSDRCCLGRKNGSKVAGEIFRPGMVKEVLTQFSRTTQMYHDEFFSKKKKKGSQHLMHYRGHTTTHASSHTGRYKTGRKHI